MAVSARVKTLDDSQVIFSDNQPLNCLRGCKFIFGGNGKCSEEPSTNVSHNVLMHIIHHITVTKFVYTYILYYTFKSYLTLLTNYYHNLFPRSRIYFNYPSGNGRITS